MEEFFVDARKEIHQPERARMLEKADTLAEEYHQGFLKIVNLHKQLVELLEKSLHPTGQTMRENLTEIMKTAHADQDAEAAYLAGRLQERVLLARLYTSKFLDTQDDAAVARAEGELQGEMKEQGWNDHGTVGQG